MSIQIFIVLSPVSVACCTSRQISLHTVSVWCNYRMIATLLYSSSVNKPLRTVWHLFNAHHLMATLLAAMAALCCGYRLPFHMLGWNTTVSSPDLSHALMSPPQWHHTSMWGRPRRKALLRIYRTRCWCHVVRVKGFKLLPESRISEFMRHIWCHR